jgi:hypothetical protein
MPSCAPKPPGRPKGKAKSRATKPSRKAKSKATGRSAKAKAASKSKPSKPRGKAKAKSTPAPKPKAENRKTPPPSSHSLHNRKSNAYNKAKYAHKKAGYSHEEACAAGRAAGCSDKVSQSRICFFFRWWPTQFDFLNPRPGLWPSDTLPNELVSQSWNPTQDGGLGEACLFPRWV